VTKVLTLEEAADVSEVAPAFMAQLLYGQRFAAVKAGRAALTPLRGHPGVQGDANVLFPFTLRYVRPMCHHQK